MPGRCLKTYFSIIKDTMTFRMLEQDYSRKENRNGVSGYRVQDIFTVLTEENFNAGVDFEEDSGVFGKSMKTVQYLYKIFKFWLIKNISVLRKWRIH